jgi:hypothetical protein
MTERTINLSPVDVRGREIAEMPPAISFALFVAVLVVLGINRNNNHRHGRALIGNQEM